MIYLISMFERRRLNFLPQFVDYYRRLGVERFLIALHLDPADDAKDNAQARLCYERLLRELEVGHTSYFEGDFASTAFFQHTDRLQELHVQSNDWIVWADSDEYQVYPVTLGELTARMAAEDINYLRGVLLDRVAADGRLATFDPARAIWDQYPMVCAVTARLAAGDNTKAVFACGWVQMSNGHHEPAALRPQSAPRLRFAPQPYPPLRCLPGLVPIHHFKWDAGVIERLKQRTTPRWKSENPHWVESQRLLDYFERHDLRFDLRDLENMKPQA